jgi:hypothetical protein
VYITVVDPTPRVGAVIVSPPWRRKKPPSSTLNAVLAVKVLPLMSKMPSVRVKVEGWATVEESETDPPLLLTVQVEAEFIVPAVLVMV